jgi:hypothetical protein
VETANFKSLSHRMQFVRRLCEVSLSASLAQ